MLKEVSEEVWSDSSCSGSSSAFDFRTSQTVTKRILNVSDTDHFYFCSGTVGVHQLGS